MNKDESVLLKSIAIDTETEESFEQLVRELKSLKSQGYRKIDVLIYKNILDEVKIYGIDETIFNKIRSVQDLPEFATLDFIMSKGTITEESFRKRITAAYEIS